MSYRSLNKVMLIGNLTRDPELKYTQSGVAIATTGIAINKSWKDADGNYKNDVEFLHLDIWGKLADVAVKILKKGSFVYIEGSISVNKWTDKEGKNRETYGIRVSDIKLLTSTKGSTDENSPSANIDEVDTQSYGEEVATDVVDDLPF